MKSKRELILVIVTILMAGVLIFGYFYDKNEKVLARTLAYEITDDMEVVKMDKHGMLLNRVSYEARIKIDHDNPEELLNRIIEAYDGFEGELMMSSEFPEFSKDVLAGMTIKPNPQDGTLLWIQGVETEEGHQIFHIMVAESDTEAYLYVYYHR